MKQKRAHPLRALLRADCSLLWRHGIAAVYLLLMLFYTAALRFLAPDGMRQRLTALLLLTVPATLSLFFMGAIVLYEKKQHIYPALYAAGVRARTCALSKCIVMSLLGTFVGCAVMWFSQPGVLMFADGALVWASLFSGDAAALCVTAAVMLLGGVLFTCLSLVICAFVSTLNGFLLTVAVVECVCLLPAVWDLFWALPAWAALHPVVWLERALLMPAAVLERHRQPVQWLSLSVLTVLLAAAFRAACASVSALLSSRREDA